MGNVTSTLDIVLTDDVTKNAAQIDAALKKLAAEAKAVDGALASSGGSDKFGAALKRVGAQVVHVEAATKALRDYAAAEGLSANRGDWTKGQVAGFRNMESVVVSGTRAIIGAEKAAAEAKKATDAAAVSSFEKSVGLWRQETAARERENERQIADDRRTAERRAEIHRQEAAREQRDRVRAYEEEQRLHHRMLEQREHGIAHHGIVNYALQSAAMAVSAHEMVHLGAEAWRQGAEMQHERIGLVNAGRTPEEIREIEQAARGVQASTPTAGFVESLKTVAETTAAFGSVEHAVANLPFISKMTSILKAAGGDNIHGDAAQLGQAFAKTFEERQTKPGDFEAEAKQMIPAMVATGGTFNPEQLYAFAQQAKSALPSLSMRFLSRIAPSLIGAQGGERAGTGLKAFEDVIAGKVNDKKQAEEFLNLGLLDPKMAIMKAGHAVGWKSGAVKDTFLAMTDPLAWSEQYLIPALKKQGVDTSNREATQMILNTMFRNQNANMFATEVAQEASRARLHKDEELYGKVGSFDEIYARNLQEFGVAAGTLKSALGNLAGAVTAPLMGVVAAGLVKLAGGINVLSNAALEHPTIAATAGVGVGAAALSGAGFMAYQLYNGFGLGASATALTGSAGAIDAAAARLGVAGGVGGPAGGTAAAAAEGAGLTLGGIVARALPPIALTAAAIGAGKYDAWVKAETAKTIDTPAGQAVPDLAKQTWGEWLRGQAPQPFGPDRPAPSRATNFDGNSLRRNDEMPVGLDAREDVAAAPIVPSPTGERFTSDLPPYVDREAERGRAYMSLRPPEAFGPPMPPAAPAPVTPTVDPASATDALFTLGSLSEETGAKMQTALSVTATPVVDTGSINAAQAAAERLASTLAQIGALASSAAAAVAGAASGTAPNASVGARRSFNRTPAGATTV